MVIILGGGGNSPDFTKVDHFYETWFGRPCCVVCGWNPSFYQRPDYIERIAIPEGKMTYQVMDGSGYADQYPSDVWRKHVLTQHKDLLDGKAFKKWALERGGYVKSAVYKVKAEELDVV